MNQMTIYGISHCDTVKKAKAYLDSMNVSYDFIDFKKNPPRDADIIRWQHFLGELPINKKGSTYRKHGLEFESLNDIDRKSFIQNNPSLIKRPILEKSGIVLAIGFREDLWKTFFS